MRIGGGIITQIILMRIGSSYNHLRWLISMAKPPFKGGQTTQMSGLATPTTTNF